jgi:hypothetical protein
LALKENKTIVDEVLLQGMHPTRFGLYQEELDVLRSLSTPIKIQEYLDTLAINHEKKGETCMSTRRVLREQKAHCIEGAFLAATALWLRGESPLLLDLKTIRGDDDHVVALYRRAGRWGAISKTNHAPLRFRDPIYKSVRELSASYFHEYFLDSTGQKTLRSHSNAFSLRSFGTSWITSEEDLWDIAAELDSAPHFSLFPKGAEQYIRSADSMERKAGLSTEWDATDSRT